MTTSRLPPPDAFGQKHGRAFSSLGCPDFDLPAMLSLARDNNIAAIELRVVAGEIDLPAYLERTYETPGRLAVLLESSSVRVHVLSTSFKLTEPTEVERARLLSHVIWAEGAGIPWLRVFDGGHSADEATLRRAAATLGWWQRLRKQSGWRVDLAVETHDSLVNNAALGRFLELAPSAALLWDAHNTWRKGGEDPAEVWQAIGPRVVHIHVKDSVSRPSARHPFTFVLPSMGEFPMKRVHLAREKGYLGLISLEWERQWHPYLPPLQAALAYADTVGWW